MCSTQRTPPKKKQRRELLTQATMRFYQRRWLPKIPSFSLLYIMGNGKADTQAKAKPIWHSAPSWHFGQAKTKRKWIGYSGARNFIAQNGMRSTASTPTARLRYRRQWQRAKTHTKRTEGRRIPPRLPTTQKRARLSRARRTTT